MSLRIRSFETGTYTHTATLDQLFSSARKILENFFGEKFVKVCFIFCPKINFELCDILAEKKLRQNVVVLYFLAVDNFIFTRKIRENTSILLYFAVDNF